MPGYQIDGMSFLYCAHEIFIKGLALLNLVKSWVYTWSGRPATITSFNPSFFAVLTAMASVEQPGAQPDTTVILCEGFLSNFSEDIISFAARFPKIVFI